MHAPIDADMADKPALQPRAAIGPAVRAIAGHILLGARSALLDPERSSQDSVHDFRRAMKEWRALMRLLEPFIADAPRWRHDARDHARSLSHARDSAAALNAFNDLLDKGVVLSERTAATIRGRIEGLRGREEEAGLTPALRDAIVAWLDAAAAAIEQWPLDPFDFSSIAGQLTISYRSAGKRRGFARAAPTRRRPALPDGIDRAAVAALRPHVDRRSRAAARPARPLPGSRSAQAAHRTAPAAGALALAPHPGLHRALDRARATRRPHRRAAVCGKAESVPPPSRAIVGARALGLLRTSTSLCADAPRARDHSPDPRRWTIIGAGIACSPWLLMMITSISAP